MGNRNSPPKKESPTVVDKNSEDDHEDVEANGYLGECVTEDRSLSENDFHVLETISESSDFSKMYLVQKKDSKNLYAMKVFNKLHLRDKQLVDYVKKSRIIHAKMKHPFVITLHFAFQNKEKLFFGFPYMVAGDLFSIMSRERSFDEDAVRLIAAEMILAVAFLHSHEIYHGDLKPENILMDAKGHIHICDFGFSKVAGEKYQKEIVGTTMYFPPEVITLLTKPEEERNEKLDSQAMDYWAFGCILYELTCGENPFHSQIEEAIYYNILNKKVDYGFTRVSKELRNLINGLLEKKKTKRLSYNNAANEIMNHPFFRGVNFHDVYNKRIDPTYVPKEPNLKRLYVDSKGKKIVKRNLGSLSPVLLGDKRKESLDQIQQEFEGFHYYDNPRTPNTPKLHLMRHPNAHLLEEIEEEGEVEIEEEVPVEKVLSLSYYEEERIRGNLSMRSSEREFTEYEYENENETRGTKKIIVGDKKRVYGVLEVEEDQYDDLNLGVEKEDPKKEGFKIIGDKPNKRKDPD